MLIRVVKMTFIPSHTNTFLSIFEKKKKQIRNTDGCLHLELMQDYNLPNSFVTYSHWKDEKKLNNYRASELFKDVWSKTKVLFSEKPITFSLKPHTLED